MAANPRLARRINDRLALDLIVAAGRMSRTQLRELTGLTQPTVIDLVSRLLSAGLIEAVEEDGPEERRRGRRPQLYAVAGGRAYAAGVHITGTRITAQIGDLAGATTPVVAVRRTETDPGRQIATVVAKAFAAAGKPADSLAACVIGTHGVVDADTGDLGYAPDLGSWQAGIRAPVSAALGCQVRLDREITLAAIAEARLGAARDLDRFALLWVGQGLGLSWIDQGAVFRGDHGAAGEVGYLPLPSPTPDPAPPRIFQDLAGSRAIRALAADHGLHRHTAQACVSAAVRSPDGAPFLAELAERISLGLHAITTVMDPGTVILAGPTAAAGGETLAGLVEAALARRSWQPVKIRTAALPQRSDTPLSGALLVATDQARDLVWGAASVTRD
ncbi:ROK family transcriptional regulator [Nonomuraea wenchangensis]|uniref:ROK family transcriptional regulator n=1 Tax=Nonomuraea wenchangensis TaxID=568860 RepID=UPI0037171435